ncbi:haloacid dehalogenase (HAD) superfamily protein [Zea mays]|uniref:Haloacid dehalogenase (HAD) superfamily protein n=1 Tax=Zea mays TaxID=4577 RepID=A0A1D6P133_MAIZE|nr:haloacid dehalogenase (HAD) superfamily protein [Zea mays]
MGHRDVQLVLSFWATLFATEVQSESKWKQLGELAMSNGKVRKLEAYIISYWYKKGHRPIEHPLLPDARRIVKFDLYDDSVSTRI